MATTNLYERGAMIDDFRFDYRWLSNFHVEKDGKSVEHRYQAAKTLDPEEHARVMRAPTPKDAKRLGRSITLRPNWDQLKFDYMLNFVRDKFQDQELADKLIATGDQLLVEGNWWGDTYWGVCKGVGQNNLGKILMQVRDEIKLARTSQTGYN